jgi:2-keto-3-deoxy-L-rhamnonate aldolase RhmA
MNAISLKKALHSGKIVFGTLIASPSPRWIDAVAGLNLDFVFIDTEHIPLDSQELGLMCHAYRGINMAPIVRITRPDPYEACKILDIGASGIIAPYVETVEEVKKLRGAVKLRPLKGKRLADNLSGEKKISSKLKQYLQNYNANNILIINIESKPAVDNLDEMLNVPDLDGILIGPHDLSVNLDIPEEYDNPIFDKTVKEIIKKGRAKKVGVGIHYFASIEQEIGWAKIGMNMIIHQSDLTLFRDSMSRDLKTLREGLGEKVVKQKWQDKAI